MQFVPLWDSMLDNLKLHRLGPEAVGKWAYMLLAAQRHDALEGTLPDLETLSFWIRQTEEATRQWLAELVAGGLIDRRGKTYVIHDWDEWRCKGDKAARERMRRKRERDKKSSENGEVSRNAERNTERNVTPDVTPHVTDELRPSISISSEQRSLAYASELNTPPPPPAFSTPPGPDHEAVIALAVERWGASSGDSVAGDLLRDYPPDLVRAAMDRHWDDVGMAIRPALLRGICRGMWNDGWPPKVKPKPAKGGKVDYKPKIIPTAPPRSASKGPGIPANESMKLWKRGDC